MWLFGRLQWQLDNLAWTDVNASSQPVTCQQLPFSQIPPSILTGGWVGLEGTDSCPGTAEMPAAGIGAEEEYSAGGWETPSGLVGHEVSRMVGSRHGYTRVQEVS